MKSWQLIAGFCVALVVVGLLLCDDIRAHNDLRDCQRAIGLKPDTAVIIVHPPRDSQNPQGVGINPAHQQAMPRLTASKNYNTPHPALGTPTPSITTAPGTAGGNFAKIDTFCIDDTTRFPDSEKIYHSLCSPDVSPQTRITGLWTVRLRQPDTQRTITKPIIVYKTSLIERWYVSLPLGIIFAYSGYCVGKATAQSRNK